jgi:hypothetical protein
MSEAISATYDVPGRRIPSPAMAVPAAHPSPGHSISRAQALDPGLDRPSSWATAAWQVREDPAFYVPDVVSDTPFDTHAKFYAAADEHARHLHRAQRNLEDALNLARVLSASFSCEDDSRAAQVETVLKIVERKLNKTLNRIDRHATRHRNLFFAYFDLKEKAEEGGEE